MLYEVRYEYNKGCTYSYFFG